MGEVLHLWALAPATVGACCVAADRGRARVPEFAAAALMLIAMADIATGAGLIAPVLWALLLVVGAMALAALRGARRRPVAAERMPHPSRAMTVVTALGLVVMAVLMIAMGVHPSSAAVGLGSHDHSAFGAWSGGGGLGPGVALTMAVAAAYVAVSSVAAVRSSVRLDRVQYASMATATALMALASLT